MDIFEKQIRDFGRYQLICGVDEAGRGPLAGPLIVSAVILKQNSYNEMLADSKKLSEKKRELLYDWVIENSLSHTIIRINPDKIDELNILQATLKGMKDSIDQMKLMPDIVLIDGNIVPRDINIHCKAIVKGDAQYACIAAASILSKVTRDRIMLEIDKKYPLYSFKKNKGYPTKEHIKAIQTHGITALHRHTYKPVRDNIRL